ncbi:MAG: hypothetical protein ACYSUT_06320, partial [Planctomycetota bacterium]
MVNSKYKMVLLLIMSVVFFSGCNPVYRSAYRITPCNDSVEMESCVHIQDSNDIINYIVSFEEVRVNKGQDGLYSLEFL